MLLLLHTAATWMMVGIIWFVQIIHYPLFDKVGEGAFPQYHKLHMNLTMRVITPPSAVEGITGVLIALKRPEGVTATQIWLGLALLAVIWTSTFLMQVPKHFALSKKYETRLYRTLVGSNWIRTAAWSLRGALTLWMISGRMN